MEMGMINPDTTGFIVQQWLKQIKKGNIGRFLPISNTVIPALHFVR